jgi:hypothetical protein
MGFRPAVEKIMRRLPNKTRRQTLLFSATMPTDVRAIASLALSENYAFVDTVSTSVIVVCPASCTLFSKRCCICISELLLLQLATSVLLQVYTSFITLSDSKSNVLLQ